ncbi:MAG: sigma-54 dependent transcriptional regulator [Planctomycetaceae bacterium]|jgi:transcriptional regulator with GAF, ATPase, and Fis domain|nr:sigma-54 dependent transcriptional regulator [Planctomycetaceae bacterium]
MDSIVGHNAGLRSVLERARLVAKSDVPVLILGETGSGKEVFARHIHEQSRRAKLPFLKVNCGAVPSELIDSYLFGHERGAFTGAMERRKGWFESANGGTLLLDEIGELPLAAQVRFLRVLQDGSFESVGGSGKTMRVDVRVIAATHRNLRQMVNENKFREDLWYRISVFPIRIPPLRERMEDLTELAFYFAKKATVKFGLPEIGIRREDVDILSKYNWPGNVREFGAVIDRAVLLGEGRRLALAESLRELMPESEIDFDPAAFALPENIIANRNADKFEKNNKEPNKNNSNNKTDTDNNNVNNNAKINADIDTNKINKVERVDKVENIESVDNVKNADDLAVKKSIDKNDDKVVPAKNKHPKSTGQKSKKPNKTSTTTQEHSISDPLAELDERTREMLAQHAAEIASFVSLNDAVRLHIEAALLLTNGIIEGDDGTAELLKVNPHTLRAKMRRLGINWSQYRKI